MILALALSGCATDYWFCETPPDEDTAVVPCTGVCIRELMAVNGEKGGFELDAGDTDIGENERFPDWIEIFNGGTSDADLEGFEVMTVVGGTESERFTFPADSTLGPGQCLLLIADGEPETQSEFVHLPFNLNKDYGGVQLRRPAGCLVDRVWYGEQCASHSWERGDRKWDYVDVPTPCGFDGVESLQSEAQCPEAPPS